MAVPLVLSKSRTKALLSRMSTAQCRLLINALAGRSWHCGSRPMRNWDKVTGMVFPSIFPGVNTTRLSFMERPHSCRWRETAVHALRHRLESGQFPQRHQPPRQPAIIP